MFIDILFESTFTTNEELINDKNLKNVYKANQDYKQVNFKKEYSCALFKYIIDNAKEDVYIPDCVKERTKAYIDSNDTLLTWATQRYIYEKDTKEKDKKNFIRVADMYDEFKMSDEYDRLHKTARPTKAIFLKNVAENKSFKHTFHPKKKVNKKDYRNIILGWRELTSNEKAELGIEEESDED